MGIHKHTDLPPKYQLNSDAYTYVAPVDVNNPPGTGIRFQVYVQGLHVAMFGAIVPSNGNMQFLLPPDEVMQLRDDLNGYLASLPPTA